MTGLAEIPVVDLRHGGTLHHARESRARAQALHDTCLEWLPGIVRPLVPHIDGIARRWLERSQSPYVEEVRAIAAALGFPGIWLLNGSYQWSCTALAREEREVPWLARTLDWPFPELGRYADIARMSGPAGEYFNVTWPGYVGVLTACAPGRFAAAINQAPMRRRSHVRLLRFYDLAANGLRTLRHVRDIPPDQLLRQAFETCRTYDEAKRTLEATPIARPAIYTLAGCRAGERCVIERTEDAANTRDSAPGAANDWLDGTPQWEARVAARRLLTSTYDEAAANSRSRREALAGWGGEFSGQSFAWIVPPVLNPFTRLGVEMCPARGIVRAVGYRPVGGEEPAVQATLPREVTAERLAA
jgi:hypothetical protein